jgi:hypothetical protein
MVRIMLQDVSLNLGFDTGFFYQNAYFVSNGEHEQSDEKKMFYLLCVFCVSC